MSSHTANAQEQGEKDRKEFLLHMYDQTWNNINRHITIVWQSVAALVASVALLSLVEKNIVPIDLAISMIVLISVWLAVNVYDANAWYSRNLVIIANIEKQFLQQQDLRDIHYFFGERRTKNSLIEHFQIQLLFGIAIAILALLYHFFTRVYPGFFILSTLSKIDLWRSLPYLVALVGSIYVAWFKNKQNKSYKKLLRESPGVQRTGEQVN